MYNFASVCVVITNKKINEDSSFNSLKAISYKITW